VCACVCMCVCMHVLRAILKVNQDRSSLNTRRNSVSVEGARSERGLKLSRDFNDPIVPNSISRGDDIPRYIDIYRSHDRVPILMPCFHHVGWTWDSGWTREIYNRNAPTLHWLSPWLYDIAKRPFESDGRRKLYDRSPARFRDITNRFDLPPPVYRATTRKRMKKDTLTFKNILTLGFIWHEIT